MQKILVTGANGQLGQCLQKISDTYSQYKFLFADSELLNLTDRETIEQVFDDFSPNFCINAAAYTAVDLAEDQPEKAFAVNAEGVEVLAEICKNHHTTLIHVSTDYVFDGNSNIPYAEDDFTSPNGVYGDSKLKGEIWALEQNPISIIIRTSWLYSEFGKNFVKTMLHLFKEKDQLQIVNDQFGQPTNANDLAETIMNIIQSERKTYGIFHFSNEGETTWFEFAKRIAELSHSKIRLSPITTLEFPTKAIRPKRSTMCLDKIGASYGIETTHWEHSLEDCLQTLHNTQS